MSGRILKCFTVMVRGEFYRKGCRIHTVHAVSGQHAIRLLRQVSGFKLFKTMYVQANHKCDPQSGQPCCYKLVVQPQYGTAPEQEVVLNGPDWSPDRQPKISPERKVLIEKMQHQRKDAYGPE